MINLPAANINDKLLKSEDVFHPGFSVDCVIFGFDGDQLKVLMINYPGFDFWKLPGSFVFKNENVDDAALRILQERTGLKNIFLRQFHLFGNKDRLDNWGGWGHNEVHGTWRKKVLEKLYNIRSDIQPWFDSRFITLGYYALVDITQVKLKTLTPDYDLVEWKAINEIPVFYADHQEIINKSLETIQSQLSVLPIGKELLPEKFTMTELRMLYEAILGRKLDRRNFQRKILSFGYIGKLNEKRKGGAHKAPSLFYFNEKKYQEAQMRGIGVSW